jgi:hypothetical protein
MTDDPKLPVIRTDTAPARLADLADLLGGESSRSRRFLGGLVIGALAGAAIAGAASRRLRSRDDLKA